MAALHRGELKENWHRRVRAPLCQLDFDNTAVRALKHAESLITLQALSK